MQNKVSRKFLNFKFILIMKQFTLLFAALFLSFSLFAQTGKISGKVVDQKTGETLIGVAVMIDGTTRGMQTDLDGLYILEGLAEGNYALNFSYIGYATKKIENIAVKNSQTAHVDLALGEASLTIDAVTVTATRKKEAVSTVLAIQKNSVTLSDVLSGETIRRSPDRNVGDAIKRVSGVTIQDNKFPVVRGLNDRYNVAFVNGVLLPSTEPDRKAFSFDIFPANLIDNIVVNKAATPDMPADFAGGLIQLNTKDIPDENFVQASVGININSETMGKDFYRSSTQSATDWLGIDNGKRAIPAGVPTQQLQTLSNDQRIAAGKLFLNDWQVENRGTAIPGINAQLSSGFSKRVGDVGRFGGVLAFNYSRNERINNFKRDFYTPSGEAIFNYNENRYQNSYLNGALANFSYKINDFNKISFKNNYNISTEINNTIRSGEDVENYRVEKGTTISRYQSNQFLASQVTGEHLLKQDGLKIHWLGGYNDITRNAPNWNQITINRASDEPSNPFTVFAQGNSASPTGIGKQFFKLREKSYVGNLNLSYPFKVGGLTHNVKGGLMLNSRNRDYDVRQFSIATVRNSTAFPIDEKSTLSSIFTNDKFNTTPSGFMMGEVSQPEFSYDAETKNNAAYVMVDNKFTDKLRLIWGVRYENYVVSLTGKGQTKKAVDNATFNRLLPSFNFLYSVTDKSNFRISGSQTVSRPELRELAPFFFYDVLNQFGRSGNPTLVQTDIYNGDIRYEIFPEGGQMFSISGFYKYFKNPVEERLNAASVGNVQAEYYNAESARNLGIEIEARKSLNFLGQAPILDDFTVFSNVAFINSRVKTGKETGDGRQLQGQSPYTVNAGLQYNNVESGLNSTILFNQIGRRILFVGDGKAGLFPIVWENPRPLLDFQIGKRIMQKGEIKFTISDIINRPFKFYQDINTNGKLEERPVDNPYISYRPGTTFALSFSYKL
jgi:TonB-dependent receptor